jgi:signal peptidase I
MNHAGISEERAEFFAELSKAFLSSGISIRFTAFGHSMHPAIKSGDIVEVEPVPVHEVTIGDIVFYCIRGSKMVLHRLIAKCRDNEGIVLTAKGDNFPFEDVPIRSEQMLGRAISIESGGQKRYLKYQQSK